MKTCQAFQQPLSPDDLLADPYTNLCRACWVFWQVEAAAPLTRYGQPNRQACICTSCGMGFGGVIGFDRHRKAGRCLSPAELQAQNRPMRIKDGILVDTYRGNAKIPVGVEPNGDFPGAGIPQWHPTHENA